MLLDVLSVPAPVPPAVPAIPLRCVPASAEDAAAIAALTHRAAPETVAVPEHEVREHIHEYEVVRDGSGRVLAAAAVRPLDDARAELRSLAVDDACRGRGCGGMLLRRAQARAGRGGRRLYCVTLCPEYFERHGFRRIELDALPPKPQRGERVDGRARVALAAPEHLRIAREARRARRA